MTINNFAFNPTDGLRNAVSFPTTPNTEADARNQPQTLLDQLRDYINNTIVTEVNNKLGLTGGTLTGNLTAPALIASGLTGATAPSRYVGATASGAPASGTFNATDWCVDATGAIWVCTVAGSPGTWKNISSGAASVLSGGSKIQSGTASGSMNDVSYCSISLTFPVAFSSAPIVVATVKSTPAADAWIVGNITNITTTGCTIYTEQNSTIQRTGNIVVAYVAIGS